MTGKPVRHSTRLQGANYEEGAYFVTICTHQKACLFGTVESSQVNVNDLGICVTTCWQAIPAHFPHVMLDHYIVMPNHIHGIVILSSEGASLGVIMQAFKAGVSRLARRSSWINSDDVLWQRNYYEHIIRNQDDLMRIRGYIIENPQRWKS
jgi:putative transposase